MTKPTPRLSALLLTFAAITGLVIYDHRSGAATQIAEAAPRSSRAGPRSDSQPSIQPKRPRVVDDIEAIHERTDYTVGSSDPFAIVPTPSNVPATVPSPVVAAPPALPPLPYTMIGKKFEAGQWEIYLASENRTLVARLGNVLDEVYRVDAIHPPQMELTYLPINQKQSLDIGAPIHD